MNETAMRTLIDRYIEAYNLMNIDRMMTFLHPEIEFKNIANGTVNARASGLAEFRRLAERTAALFSSRQQRITDFWTDGDQANIEVSYEAVVARDLPNGMKAGQTLWLTGRSEFTFVEGKIYRITDYS